MLLEAACESMQWAYEVSVATVEWSVAAAGSVLAVMLFFLMGPTQDFKCRLNLGSSKHTDRAYNSPQLQAYAKSSTKMQKRLAVAAHRLCFRTQRWKAGAVTERIDIC